MLRIVPRKVPFALVTVIPATNPLVVPTVTVVTLLLVLALEASVVLRVSAWL